MGTLSLVRRWIRVSIALIWAVAFVVPHAHASEDYDHANPHECVFCMVHQTHPIPSSDLPDLSATFEHYPFVVELSIYRTPNTALFAPIRRGRSPPNR